MSSKNVIRVLVPGDDLDNEAIAQAISLGIELSKKSAAEIDGVVIFVPTKGNIKHSSLEAVLGEKITNTLYKSDEVKLHSDITLRIETIRTFKAAYKKYIVVVIYADAKMMDQVDAMPNLHTIIAVPHISGALEAWSKTWAPNTLGEDSNTDNTIIADAIIVSALSSLTSSINLSGSILHPRDKEHADNTVRILRRNNHSEEPSNVRAWAIKNGWNPKAADELKKIWDKIYKLKSKPSIKDTIQAKKSYEYWVSKK